MNFQHRNFKKILKNFRRTQFVATLCVAIFVFVSCLPQTDPSGLGVAPTAEGFTDSLNGNCSILSGSTELDRALQINSSLQALVNKEDQDCKTAVGDFQTKFTAAEDAIRNVEKRGQSALMINQRISDLTVEKQTLEARLEGAGLTEEQTKEINAELTAVEGDLKESRKARKAQGYEIDQSVWQDRQLALDELDKFVIGMNQLSLQCQNSPQVGAAAARTGLNLATAIASLSGTGLLVIDLLSQVAVAAASMAPSSPQALAQELQRPLTALAVACGVEAVAENYCHASLKSDQVAATRACGISDPMVSQFGAVADLLPVFSELKNRPGQKTGDGKATELRLSETDIQIEPLRQAQGQINSYIDSIEASMRSFDTRKDLPPTFKGTRDQLKATLGELKAMSASLTPAVVGYQDTAIVEMLKDGKFYNTLHRVMKFHRSFMIEYHENPSLRPPALRGPNLPGQASAEEKVDADLTYLTFYSLATGQQDWGADFVAELQPEISEQGQRNLAFAVGTSHDNLKAFSTLIGQPGSPYLSVFASEIKRRRDDAKKATAESDRRSFNTIARTLCASSLSLFNHNGVDGNPVSIPADIKEGCAEEEFDGVPYENLANRPWRDRVCYSVEMGHIGRSTSP